MKEEISVRIILKLKKIELNDRIVA